VQDIPESPNILLVKAGSANFEPTNLSVVTTDGSVYAFPVRFNVSPVTWVWQIPVRQQASIATYANAIAVNLLTMRGVRDRSYSMEARVSGIYIKDQVIYYQLSLNNTSPIDYDIDFLRFYIRDRRKSKRTASQENELVPLYVAGNTAVVKGCSHNTVVVALEKFTVPDAKFLAIEINEHNGGRHLLMKVGNKHIVKAIKLPDLR
jgi:conjugative transposon TraN protein